MFFCVNVYAQDQTVLLENFGLAKCQYTSGVHRILQDWEENNTEILPLSCYVDKMGNVSADVAHSCAMRAARYRHNNLFTLSSPMIVFNGTYASHGQYPNILKSASAMVSIEDSAQPFYLGASENVLRAELPMIPNSKPMELVLFAYNREGVLEDNSDHNTQHEHYIEPKPGPKENLVNAIKILGPWNGHKSSISIPLNSFKADGYVLIAQETNHGPVVAMGHYRSKSTQSGM